MSSTDFFLKRYGIPRPTKKQIEDTKTKPKAPYVEKPRKKTSKTFVKKTVGEKVSESYETMKEQEKVPDIIQKNIMTLSDMQKGIKPTGKYIVTTPSGKTITMTGVALKTYILAQKGEQRVMYEQAQRSYVQSQKNWQFYLSGKREWHPETYVKETDKGSQVIFPYAGAEKYRTYYQKLKEHGAVLGFATALTGDDPLGIPTSYYMATGQKQKAIDIKIKSLARIKSIKSPLDAAIWYVESPVGQIGIAAIGGYGAGRIGTYAAGRVSTSILATRALQAGGLIVGGSLVAPAVFDIKSTWESGKEGEALGKAGMFGFMFASGYAGYKAGQFDTSSLFPKSKGLTAYERGAKTAHIKMVEKGIAKGTIKPDVGEAVLQATRARAEIIKDIRLRGLKPYQPEIKYETIQSLKKEPRVTRWFKKQLPIRKSKVYGGAASDKPSTHDIDLAYRSALRHVESEYAVNKLTGGDFLKKFADVHPWTKKGQILSRMGEFDEGIYRHPSGTGTQKWSEQFAKLSRSALHLEHEGRIKDIPESVRLLGRIYEGTGGVPSKIQPHVKSYVKATSYLYEHPFVMSKETSSYLYGTSLAKKWYNVKKSFYRKVIPGRVKEHGFKQVYDPTGEYALSRAKVEVLPTSEMQGLYGKTTTYWIGKHKITKYPIYTDKPSIKLSVSAYSKGEAGITLKHEMLHHLHPRTPEWMIRGTKFFPGAEKISHPRLDHLVSLKLPPAPSIPYQPSVSSVSLIPSSSIGGFIGTISSFVSMPSSKFIPPTYYIPSSSKKFITSYPQIKPVKSSIISKTSPSTVIPKITSSPSVIPSKTSISKSYPASIPTSSSTSKSSSSYSYTPIITSITPSILPRKIYGRGKRTGDFSLYGKKYKFRMVKIPDPFKGGL